MSDLTLDLGNSALKAVAWGASAPVSVRVEWDADWRGALRELVPGPVERAIVSSVVGAERLREVTQWLTDLGAEPRVNPSSPLAIGCRSEATIGRDRLFAAWGAWALGGEPAVVVDAGTAVTVDALVLRDGRPTFQGGAIAPGPRLLAEALRAGGAQLAAFDNEPRADAPALGQDSREALEAGVSVGFQGAVRELVRRVATEAGLADAPVRITGGASALLGDDALFDGRVVHRDPWLVHLGLRAAADSAEG